MWRVSGHELDVEKDSSMQARASQYVSAFISQGSARYVARSRKRRNSYA